ncbi:hypothetical protein [Asanoa iriomotensis]|uniref:Uncharacterized protein n=1 Tax=Asanoa iriomotensis TaxID=234613 RepID=A0ABQ4C197_9ACTN|nr:hypothetical protein [Asanoa iriomotensis]GIF56556.1 hypothetical protein Air01nite_26510 [Asanoa iriomotensis]
MSVVRRTAAGALALLTVLVGAAGPAYAAVDDPAQSATPYHVGFPLFRSANMANRKGGGTCI